MSDPYRGTVEVDVEATKAAEEAKARWERMSPLDRARIIYERLAVMNTPQDPEKRQKTLADFQRARDEYFRLLAEHNAGR